MEDATSLSDVYLAYAVGGNSQKAGGALRTIAGFSTGAKEKSATSLDLKPISTTIRASPSAHLNSAPRAAVYSGCLWKVAEDSSLSNVEAAPSYTGIKCYRHYKMFYNFYGST